MATNLSLLYAHVHLFKPCVLASPDNMYVFTDHVEICYDYTLLWSPKVLA